MSNIPKMVGLRSRLQHLLSSNATVHRTDSEVAIARYYRYYICEEKSAIYSVTNWPGPCCSISRNGDRTRHRLSRASDRHRSRL